MTKREEVPSDLMGCPSGRVLPTIPISIPMPPVKEAVGAARLALALRVLEAVAAESQRPDCTDKCSCSRCVKTRFARKILRRAEEEKP
jgi:hypothetical protein